MSQMFIFFDDFFFFFYARSLTTMCFSFNLLCMLRKGHLIVNIKAQEERQVVVVALFISCNLSWYVTK